MGLQSSDFKPNPFLRQPQCGRLSAKMVTKMSPILECICPSPARGEVYFPSPGPGLALRLAFANGMHGCLLGSSSHAEMGWPIGCQQITQLSVVRAQGEAGQRSSHARCQMWQ